MVRKFTFLVLLVIASQSLARAATAPATQRVCGVYTTVIEFAARDARQRAIDAQPPFLMEKHKPYLAGDNTGRVELARNCGFDTLFMTIYPLWGKSWWDLPAARGLVLAALAQGREHGFRVHLGLSLFNAHMCADPSKYPNARSTIQCDGTRPSWVCFLDDGLWEFFRRNVVEMAKAGRVVPGVLDGIFIDPESYGPECYLCFCDNCVRKFNAWSDAAAKMPLGLVKPDGWLHQHDLWKKYTVDWHEAEVRRHAEALRRAIHEIDSKLQLSSLLWEYPVAVGQDDARARYFRMLALGLGTTAKPSWMLPEHTYYSDAADLSRLITNIEDDIADMGAAGEVKVLPGIRLLRRDAASLIDRAAVIKNADVPGYWLYELADLGAKQPIAFEGELIEPAENYIKALRQANDQIRRP